MLAAKLFCFIEMYFKYNKVRGSKMVQQVFVAKPDYLSSSPGSFNVEGAPTT